MAITIVDVKSGSGQATSAQLAAFASNPVTGDTVVVGIAMFSSGTINAPTDTAGNTYTQIGTTQNAPSTQLYMGLFYAKNITGGSTFRVTISFNASHHYAVVAWVLHGVDANPYNGDWVTHTAFSNAPNAGPSAGAPGVANSLFFGILNTPAVVTTGSGWNTTGANGFTAGMATAAVVADYAAHDAIYSEYKISSVAEGANWSLNANNQWVAMQASFAPSTAPPPAAWVSSPVMVLEYERR